MSLRRTPAAAWAAVLWAAAAAVPAPAQDKPGKPLPPEGKTVETAVALGEREEGLGSGQRTKVEQALRLMQQRKVKEAEPLLEEVLAYFAKQMSDREATYVCVNNRAELLYYSRAHPEKKKVVWLDWAFGSALQQKAFAAAARKEWDAALKVLDRAIALRPCAAEPFTERGYILSITGRPKEGLKAYQTALERSQRFASSKPLQAMALRGIGFSLIELGDLAGARAAYERSLKIEPNNRVALHELDHIKQLEAKKKPPRP
jgi:tetratricopeptide (TPR) repeat protein